MIDAQRRFEVHGRGISGQSTTTWLGEELLGEPHACLVASCCQQDWALHCPFPHKRDIAVCQPPIRGECAFGPILYVIGRGVW